MNPQESEAVRDWEPHALQDALKSIYNQPAPTLSPNLVFPFLTYSPNTYLKPVCAEIWAHPRFSNIFGACGSITVALSSLWSERGERKGRDMGRVRKKAADIA